MEDFETLGDYLAKYNPLALKNDKNQILHFKTYDDAYLYVLKETRTYCTRGYVEIPLLVKHLTGFDDETCMEITDIIIRYNKSLKDEPHVIDWHRIERSKEILEAVVKGLHSLTETEFSWSSFEYAWVIYKQWIEKINGKENH